MFLFLSNALFYFHYYELKNCVRLFQIVFYFKAFLPYTYIYTIYLDNSNNVVKLHVQWISLDWHWIVLRYFYVTKHFCSFCFFPVFVFFFMFFCLRKLISEKLTFHCARCHIFSSLHPFNSLLLIHSSFLFILFLFFIFFCLYFLIC